MSWINPKTDWKEIDYYNFTDLDRVENNTAEIIAFLKSIKFIVPVITSVTDRDMTKVEFLSSINRVEANIEAIRKNFITPPGYQAKKVWSLGRVFDYRDANRLESNLESLHYWALKAKDNQRFCGTFSAGQDIVL